MFGKFLFSACSLLLEDLGSTTRWRPSSTTFNMARHVADAMAFPCRHKNIIISFSHCFGVSSPRSKNLAAKGRGRPAPWRARAASKQVKQGMLMLLNYLVHVTHKAKVPGWCQHMVSARNPPPPVHYQDTNALHPLRRHPVALVSLLCFV